MNNVEGKYLPIGTVVLLKGASKRLMITGFCTMPSADQSVMFDYSGCLYPEGVVSSEQTALFNHDQIEKVFFVGYKDDEEVEFKNKLSNLISTVNTINNVPSQQANVGFTVNSNNNSNQVV